MNHTFDNNGLIADFMGKPRHQEYKSHFRVDNEDGSVGMIHAEEFKYHTSWDWLMPVLSKILDLSFQDDADAEDFYSIRDCVPDINHTYKAVVEFIEGLSVEPDTKAD